MRRTLKRWFQFSLISLTSLASTLTVISPPAKLMDSATSFAGSQRLVALAHQLRHYRPPPTPLDDDDDSEEPTIEGSAGKVVSQVGVEESAAPISRDPERFRPKRAAVLICLFEDDAGDLRVILTKRSSTLSTHSGWFYIFELVMIFCLVPEKIEGENMIVRWECCIGHLGLMGCLNDVLQVKLRCQVGKQRRGIRMMGKRLRERQRRKLVWILPLSMLLLFLNHSFLRY